MPPDSRQRYAYWPAFCPEVLRGGLTEPTDQVAAAALGNQLLAKMTDKATKKGGDLARRLWHIRVAIPDSRNHRFDRRLPDEMCKGGEVSRQQIFSCTGQLKAQVRELQQLDLPSAWAFPAWAPAVLEQGGILLTKAAQPNLMKAELWEELGAALYVLPRAHPSHRRTSCFH